MWNQLMIYISVTFHFNIYVKETTMTFQPIPISKPDNKHYIYEQVYFRILITMVTCISLYGGDRLGDGLCEVM